MPTCYDCRNKFCCDALDYNPITGIRTEICSDFEPLKYDEEGNIIEEIEEVER